MRQFKAQFEGTAEQYLKQKSFKADTLPQWISLQVLYMNVPCIFQIEREDEIVALRVQLEQDLDLKKQKLADNIQLIKLQREVRRSTAMLSTYESQYQSLETNYNSANETIGQLELQVSNIQEELRTEQTKNINLTKQADQAASVLHQMKEIQAQMNSLQVKKRQYLLKKCLYRI